MAYLHCHTKDCGWSQDDFWDLRPRFRWKSYKKSWWKLDFDIGYNPISRMWRDIKWLWKPRWMGLDDWVINDITKYTGVKVKVREVQKTIDQTNAKIKCGNCPDIYEVTETQVFSWSWLMVEAVKNWRNFRHMKWWTHKSWKKDRDTAVCPKCNERNFDID
jgi:Zn finger protein HypA/HybF involved in hydrogenase expression